MNMRKITLYNFQFCNDRLNMNNFKLHEVIVIYMAGFVLDKVELGQDFLHSSVFHSQHTINMVIHTEIYHLGDKQ
jgi:hypothetical protein